MSESTKKKFEKVREIIIVTLLIIWMIIPFLKGLQLTADIVLNCERIFIVMAGMVGIYFFIIDIYQKIIEKEDFKEYNKQILPIYILTVFMIWTFISCIFAENKDYAFRGTPYRGDGYLSYIAYSGFFFSAFLIKDELKKKRLMNIFLLTVILNIIMAELVNNSLLTNIIVNMRVDTTVFLQFNHYGYYLLMATVTSLFLGITEKNKIIKTIYIIIYMCVLYYLIINNTFGCYLALAATLILFLVYCLYKKKNIVFSILAILIFILTSMINQEVSIITSSNINIFFGDIKNIFTSVSTGKTEEMQEVLEASGTNRGKLWKYGIKFFFENPILGYGPENLGDKYLAVGADNDRPHNLLIQLGTTSGIIGLISYISAIAIIWIRGLNKSNFDKPVHMMALGVVTAYLISAMFGNSMYYTSPYFFIFLGLLMNENVNYFKKENNK